MSSVLLPGEAALGLITPRPALPGLSGSTEAWTELESCMAALSNDSQVSSEPHMYGEQSLRGLFNQLWYLAAWRTTQADSALQTLEPRKDADNDQAVTLQEPRIPSGALETASTPVSTGRGRSGCTNGNRAASSCSGAACNSTDSSQDGPQTSQQLPASFSEVTLHADLLKQATSDPFTATVTDSAEHQCIMHMLGLTEAADASDLLYAMGKIPASASMLQEAACASERAAKLVSSKRAAEELANAAPLRRPRRVPGGDPLDNEPFRRLITMIRGNSTEFEANGRVLRLKQYMPADANQAHIEAVLDALEVNDRVEALYIQNFEKGMRDEQLAHLVQVLRRKRIWALNVGENFHISLPAWEMFTNALLDTAVAYLYVSEHHIKGTNLKTDMRNAIRANRKEAPPRDAEVCSRIKNMWFNPKPPPHLRSLCLPEGGVCEDDNLVRRRLWGRQDLSWNFEGVWNPAVNRKRLFPAPDSQDSDNKRVKVDSDSVRSMEELALKSRSLAAAQLEGSVMEGSTPTSRSQAFLAGFRGPSTNPSNMAGFFRHPRAETLEGGRADEGVFRRAGSEPPPMSHAPTTAAAAAARGGAMGGCAFRRAASVELDAMGTSDTPLRAAYAQLRHEAFSPLKSPRRWAKSTEPHGKAAARGPQSPGAKPRGGVNPRGGQHALHTPPKAAARAPAASSGGGALRAPRSDSGAEGLAVTPRRAVVRKPRAIAFTQTEMGKIVKSPRRKLAETIAQKNGLPSLPTMIQMGVVPAGQLDLVVKGRTHKVYLFPDGTLTCEGAGYASLSAFSLAAMRLVTPGRQSSCGWWDVTYKGIKFGKLREQAAQQAGGGNGDKEGLSPGNIKPRYKSSPAPAMMPQPGPADA
ncbi:hypothetical protein WJX73_002300 [Symbiochloris irregularis]|uniref:RAMA domain-containing protein n=1 Tax=Symbiochloris irregularis TaxID=706552 RepID=A0AAW1NQX9_9CHLO